MNTLSSIAGFCNEKALWKLLVDLISEQMGNNPPKWIIPTPTTVLVDGDDFRFETNGLQEMTSEFYPPEGIMNYGESGFVWSLGALVCYTSSGHYVFGGRGGSYQRSRPDVELPSLRKEHSSLTPIVRRCLCYAPSQRVSLDELRDLAVKGLKSNTQMNRVKLSKESGVSKESSEYTDSIWPEEMVV